MSPETGPYIYSEVHPLPSTFPPFRVYDFDPGGHATEPRSEDDKNKWIIFYPSQPADDDVYAVYWTGKEWQWKVAGYGQFGEPYHELDENAAVILLDFFDLLDRASHFSPTRLQFLSPEDLLQQSQEKANND
jgi:hypothetical protein